MRGKTKETIQFSKEIKDAVREVIEVEIPINLPTYRRSAMPLKGFIDELNNVLRLNYEDVKVYFGYNENNDELRPRIVRKQLDEELEENLLREFEKYKKLKALFEKNDN